MAEWSCRPASMQETNQAGFQLCLGCCVTTKPVAHIYFEPIISEMRVSEQYIERIWRVCAPAARKLLLLFACSECCIGEGGTNTGAMPIVDTNVAWPLSDGVWSCADSEAPAFQPIPLKCSVNTNVTLHSKNPVVPLL
jgi:hypothetical protein